MELRRLGIYLSMLTSRFLCIVIVILGVFTLFPGCLYENSSVLPFIRSVTRVSIPSSISTISEFDQGELKAGGKYQLEQKDVESFLSKNSFRPIDQEYLLLSHFNLMGKADLFPISDSIPISDTSHLQYFYGCKEGNSWIFTLHEKSGKLWIEIQYPDFQDQGPACGF